MKLDDFKKVKLLFNSRPDRERLLLLIASLLLICFFWVYLFLIPVKNQLSALSEPIDSAKAALKISVSEYDQLDLIANSPINNPTTLALQQTENRLRQTLLDLDTNMAFKKLILPYDRLRGLLQDVLKTEPGLSVDRLEDLPSHNQMLLQFHGDYFACLRYFQRLENSHWFLFFDDFDYQVTEYPSATIKVILRTPQEKIQ